MRRAGRRAGFVARRAELEAMLREVYARFGAAGLDDVAASVAEVDAVAAAVIRWIGEEAEEHEGRLALASGRPARC